MARGSTTASIPGTSPIISAIVSRPLAGGDWNYGESFANVYIHRTEGRGAADSIYEFDPLRVEVHNHEYRHDVAIFYVENTAKNRRELCEGRPVTILYGRLPNRYNAMVGYLVRVEMGRLKDREDQLCAYAIGATWRMKARKNRVWENVTTSQIIREIARDHYFDADVLKGDKLWPHLVQTEDETEWEFLVRVCQESRLTLSPHNTTLLARPRDLITLPENDRIQLIYDGYIRHLDITVDFSIPSRGVSTDIRPNEPPQVFEPGSPDIMVDPLKMLCMQARGEHFNQPKPSRRELDRLRQRNVLAPLSLAETSTSWYRHTAVDVIMQNLWTQLMPVKAVGHLNGNARVEAGKVIRLDNRGRQDIIYGRWLVESVWHVVLPNDYFMRVELAKDNVPDAEDERPLEDIVHEWPKPAPPSVQIPEDDRVPGTHPRPRPPVSPPVIVYPTDPRPPVIPPEEPLPGDGDPPGTPIAEPQPEPPQIPAIPGLGGPTCPVQPRPFLPAEWRAIAPARIGDQRKEDAPLVPV